MRKEEILEQLKKRPLTTKEVLGALGGTYVGIYHRLSRMVKNGEIESRLWNGERVFGWPTGFVKPNRKGGFAAMDPAKRREVTSKGGKAAHRLGKAHKWTSEEAKEAGRIGGSRKKTTV